MIIKSFEIDKINKKNINFFLFYGENDGFKSEAINNIFNLKSVKNIHRYDEKDILDNQENFYNTILSKSLFENEKLIIIMRASDKIFKLTEEIIEKKPQDIKLIFNAGILDKKSKLRSLFEKSRDTICIPFYSDNPQSLMNIVNNFFKNKKISISQDKTNLLIERCRGDRLNLRNELNKIEIFLSNKKNISIDEILKLTNLAENYNISELVDSCLAKNLRKATNILNENNFSTEDCIQITRTLLLKSKRLHKLLGEINNKKTADEAISQFKPPIFWKDKETVKKQIKSWTLNKTESLIYQTNEIELLVKKNSFNGIHIISDFIISQSN
tara:strand:- start:1412 stop:2395 length:984 start_codon:yes stop_codon:yes gene_type:complete